MNDKNTKISELTGLIRKFRDERGWRKFHTPRNLATSIMLESCELLELFQWDINVRRASDLDKLNEKAVRKELADILIYLISLAEVLEFDLSTAVRSKLKHNKKKYPTKYFNNKFQDKSYYRKLKARHKK